MKTQDINKVRKAFGTKKGWIAFFFFFVISLILMGLGKLLYYECFTHLPLARGFIGTQVTLIVKSKWFYRAISGRTTNMLLSLQR